MSEALAAALQEEKFWGVAVEVAAALGEAGGDISRDTLINGLSHTHPKVRSACARYLGKFSRDAKAATALKQLLEKGDASYFVEAAALTSYAKLQQTDVAPLLLPWLTKPSHAEVLRIAVLEGLASARDLTSLDVLISWTKRGKPLLARQAALEALAELVQSANPTDTQRQKIADSVTSCLQNNESKRIRLTAVSALRDMGRSATPALETLEALAQHDPDARIRDLAQKAVDKIHSDTSPPVEVTRLREELERLRRSQEELGERLGRYEKAEQSKK